MQGAVVGGGSGCCTLEGAQTETMHGWGSARRRQGWVLVVSTGKMLQRPVASPVNCCSCQDLLPLWSLLCGGLLSC